MRPIENLGGVIVLISHEQLNLWRQNLLELKLFPGIFIYSAGE